LLFNEALKVIPLAFFILPIHMCADQWEAFSFCSLAAEQWLTEKNSRGNVVNVFVV
jgi:hypothetical protein